jgi:predicted CoA-binding protein
MSNKETVAVLGASTNPERYSNKAVKMLQEHGHRVIPINPTEASIEGVPAVKGLEEITQPVDTLSVYVAAQHQAALADKILQLAPKRVIFNPGTENPALQAQLDGAGIPWEEACTLVLLRTGQF